MAFIWFFSWWLVLALCGLAVLPLAWRLFARLPGRGYALARPLGLLLIGYVLWLGASFRLIANTTGGILLAFLLVAAFSFWLGRDGLRASGAGAGSGLRSSPLVLWLRGHWSLVLTTELLILVVFGAWAFFRAHSGDISGTEKPMEFAFINGVLNSRFFPPQDPWLSGYAISYYYFGYVMLGLLVRLAGVDPAIGFNLGVASWYALTLAAAFSLSYDLVRLAALRRRPDLSPHAGQARVRQDEHGRAIRFGLLGVVFVGIMGNLEGLVEVAYHRRLVPLNWIQWLDVKGLADAPPSGDWTGGFWWWWRASRVVHDQFLGHTFEVIDEFPFFSFLLGDLHPHVLALPFVLLTIGLSLNLLLEASSRRLHVDSVWNAVRGESRLARFWDSVAQLTCLGTPGVIIYSVLLGGLAFLNTWDFPIYLALLTLALGVGLALQAGLSPGLLGWTAGAGVTFGLLGVLLYLPFYLGFQSQAGGLLPNLLFPTRLSQFFLMFGPFLVIVVFFFALLSGGVSRRDLGRGFARTLPWTLLLPAALIGLLLLAGLLLPQGRALVDGLLDNDTVRNVIGDRTAVELAGLILQVRLANPWTFLLLAGLIAWAAGLLWARLKKDREPRPAAAGPGPDFSEPDLFAVLLAGVALTLTLSVEFLFLQDAFSSRMNTVFKFYYQAWILLALAGVYGISRLAARETPAALALPGLALSALLVLVGLYYPLMATPSKADNFRGPATLDGLAFLRNYNPGDAAAIDWIRANVPPDAIVLEAPGGSYSTEGAGRVSMSTGNPTLLGWDFHEMQWRGDAYGELVAGRPEAADQIYRTAGAAQLPAILDQWDIDYVYVGELERRKYGITDAQLARLDAALRLVYDAQGVRIYAR